MERSKSETTRSGLDPHIQNQNDADEYSQDEHNEVDQFLKNCEADENLVEFEELHSTPRGRMNQWLAALAVLVLTAGAGHCVGLSAVLLPRLAADAGPMHAAVDGLGSWIASVHSAATPIGALASGPIMEAVGRRRALQLGVVPLLIGWLIIVTAGSITILLLGRVVCGLAVGVLAAALSVYLGEVPEPKLRGILMGTPFVAYSVGVLYVYIFGSYLSWRAVAGLSMVLPAIAFVALSFSPESPIWLARKGRLTLALENMKTFRGNEKLAKREIYKILKAQRHEKNRGEDNVSLFETVKQPAVLKPLIIVNVFNFLQNFSGTYLIIFYAVNIITDVVGNVAVDSFQIAILTAVVRLLSSIVACYLLMKIGRRTLALISGVGSTVSICVLAILLCTKRDIISESYHIYLIGSFILLYVATNTIGFMVLPGLMVGELLPSKVRGLFGGYIFMLYYAVMFVGAKVFPSLMRVVDVSGIFIMFGVSSLLATVFLYLMLPESKGKSLLEIEDYFKRSNIFWTTRKKYAHHEIV